MNDEIKRIQDLLDKYMDGATSNEEEATLRKYFEEHGNDIPEEWESYRALFGYIGFEQMNLSQILKEEEKEIEKEDILEDEEKNIPKKEKKKDLFAYTINKKGNVKKISKSYYDSKKQTVNFTTKSFSKFAVGGRL